jgi:Nif-specific regulatory protein
VPLRNSANEVIGAFEVINKQQGPFDDDDQQALTELASYAAGEIESTRQFEQLLNQHKQLVDQAAARVQLLGESPALQQLRATVPRVAGTDLAVLILGENGVGKEVVAQSIHYQSPRRDRPFVAVNCAAIAETLLESELFGHEQGAFTDARESRQGKFELASGGTLFLDEIGDMSPAGQAKLLRVLEEKTVVRVGGSKPIAVDVRIVAATNQDLAKLVADRKFRQDLFFRINVVPLTLPPLRDRAEDVLLLAEHFLESFCRQAKRPALSLSRAARDVLTKHRWPGNVRELRNLMERVAYLCPGETISPEDLSLSGRAGESAGLLTELADKPLAEATDQFQIAHIKQMIAGSGGNMSTAADRLGLHRTNLYRKMRQLGIEASEK